MKSFIISTIACVVVAVAVAPAQVHKPQGMSFPTDPRECQRQLAIDLRSVPMGVSETTFVAKERPKGKSADAVQSVSSRQQAMMNYNDCLSSLMDLRVNRSSNNKPVVPSTPTGVK